MGIRIDPTLELVWRDPHTVQLGVDPARAVVPVPTLAEERFLLALQHEVPREALPAVAEHAGCTPAVAAAVLAAAAPAVLDMLPEPLVRVELLGAGSLTDAIDAQLVGEGLTVVRTEAPRGGPVPTTDPPPRLAVVVADHVLDPAVRSAWSRRPVPHLAVVVGDGRARIGPVVEADAAPCLQCVELARADEDPAWATVAAQVWGRPAVPLSPHRVAAIAAEVVRMVLDRLPRTTVRPDGCQVLVDRADLTISARAVPPHPRCGCRALRGTDSASGRHRASSPDATTSPSPSGGHA